MCEGETDRGSGLCGCLLVCFCRRFSSHLLMSSLQMGLPLSARCPHPPTPPHTLHYLPSFPSVFSARGKQRTGKENRERRGNERCDKKTRHEEGEGVEDAGGRRGGFTGRGWLNGEKACWGVRMAHRCREPEWETRKHQKQRSDRKVWRRKHGMWRVKARRGATSTGVKKEKAAQ